MNTIRAPRPGRGIPPHGAAGADERARADPSVRTADDHRRRHRLQRRRLRSPSAQQSGGRPGRRAGRCLATHPAGAPAAQRRRRAAGLHPATVGPHAWRAVLSLGFFVRLQQPYTAGLHRHGKMWIYISRGTGYWGRPSGWARRPRSRGCACARRRPRLTAHRPGRAKPADRAGSPRSLTGQRSGVVRQRTALQVAGQRDVAGGVGDALDLVDARQHCSSACVSLTRTLSSMALLPVMVWISSTSFSSARPSTCWVMVQLLVSTWTRPAAAGRSSRRQPGGDALDLAIALQALDALVHGRRGQVQQFAQFGIAGRGVGGRSVNSFRSRSSRSDIGIGLRRMAFKLYGIKDYRCKPLFYSNKIRGMQNRNTRSPFRPDVRRRVVGSNGLALSPILSDVARSFSTTRSPSARPFPPMAPPPPPAPSSWPRASTASASAARCWAACWR